MKRIKYAIRTLNAIKVNNITYKGGYMKKLTVLLLTLILIIPASYVFGEDFQRNTGYIIMYQPNGTPIALCYP